MRLKTKLSSIIIRAHYNQSNKTGTRHINAFYDASEKVNLDSIPAMIYYIITHLGVTK